MTKKAGENFPQSSLYLYKLTFPRMSINIISLYLQWYYLNIDKRSKFLCFNLRSFYSKYLIYIGFSDKTSKDKNDHHRGIFDHITRSSLINANVQKWVWYSLGIDCSSYSVPRLYNWSYAWVCMRFIIDRLIIGFTGDFQLEDVAKPPQKKKISRKTKYWSGYEEDRQKPCVTSVINKSITMKVVYHSEKRFQSKRLVTECYLDPIIENSPLLILPIVSKLIGKMRAIRTSKEVSTIGTV